MIQKKTQRILEVKKYIKLGLTNPEIGKQLGVSTSTIANIVKRHLDGNPNHMNSYKHRNRNLYSKCLKYYQNHSFKETADKFDLTLNELKSVMTYAYRDKSLLHIRKDSRRKDPWSIAEYRKLIQMSGLVQRKTIGSYLNRSIGYQGIKDRLALLKLKSRNVNGLTYSQYLDLFDKKPPFYFKTNAGSGRTRILLIPWVSISKKQLKDQPVFIKKMIESMSIFQMWVYSTRSKKLILNKMNNIINSNKL